MKTKYNIRRRFYIYLRITLLILVSIRFGFEFSVGSKNNPIDSEDQEQNNEESTFSRGMKFISYQNIFENLDFSDSLPDSEKTKFC